MGDHKAYTISGNSASPQSQQVLLSLHGALIYPVMSLELDGLQSVRIRRRSFRAKQTAEDIHHPRPTSRPVVALWLGAPLCHGQETEKWLLLSSGILGQETL